jgi:hypothetical protein
LFLSPYINALLTKALQHLADDAFHVLLVDLAFRAAAAALAKRSSLPADRAGAALAGR